MFMDGMSSVVHSTELPTEVSEVAERHARHLRMLARLADIGMELVEHVRQQVLEEASLPAVDPSLAFTRLAKAVRQTLALEAKVAADGFGSAPLSSRGAAPAGVVAGAGFGAWRARVRGAVEGAIASAAESDGDEAERLLLDMQEQLDDPEFEDELADWPIGVVVASICRALGVGFDPADFSDAEMGLDPRLRHPVGAMPEGHCTLQGVSAYATGVSESRAETDVRFLGRPAPDD
jgi:hypothetical protein